ncbi:hypothetical protein, partial [Nocardia rhamnosiphila]
MPTRGVYTGESEAKLFAGEYMWQVDHAGSPSPHCVEFCETPQRVEARLAVQASKRMREARVSRP